MATEEERIASLEREVKQLNIKVETLVNFLNTSKFGPPDGREPYDVLVESNLAEFDLKDSVENHFTAETNNNNKAR